MTLTGADTENNSSASINILNPDFPIFTRKFLFAPGHKMFRISLKSVLVGEGERLVHFSGDRF